MEKFVDKLIEMYQSSTLKSKEELESFKSLMKDAYKEGFIAGEQSIINVIDKLIK